MTSIYFPSDRNNILKRKQSSEFSVRLFTLEGPHHLIVFGRDPNNPMSRESKNIKEFDWGEACLKNIVCCSRWVRDLFYHTVDNPAKKSRSTAVGFLKNEIGTPRNSRLTC